MNQRYPIVSCSAWLHGCGHNEWPEYSNDVLLGVMGMVVSARLVATARQVHEGQPLSPPPPPTISLGAGNLESH